MIFKSDRRTLKNAIDSVSKAIPPKAVLPGCAKTVGLRNPLPHGIIRKIFLLNRCNQNHK